MTVEIARARSGPDAQDIESLHPMEISCMKLLGTRDGRKCATYWDILQMTKSVPMCAHGWDIDLSDRAALHAGQVT